MPGVTAGTARTDIIGPGPSPHTRDRPDMNAVNSPQQGLLWSVFGEAMCRPKHWRQVTAFRFEIGFESKLLNFNPCDLYNV